MYRKIAVDAPHIGFAQLDDLLEDRVRMARAGIVGIDQNRQTLRLWFSRHGRSRKASPGRVRLRDFPLSLQRLSYPVRAERAMLLGQWRVFPEASLPDTGTETAGSSVAIRNPYLRAFVPFPGVSRACSAYRQAFRRGVCGVHLLPPAAGTAAACDRDPPARLAPPRGRAWPGAERRMDVREGVPAARNHRSQGRRHHADSHGTRRQLAHFSHSYVHARSRR